MWGLTSEFYGEQRNSNSAGRAKLLMSSGKSVKITFSVKNPPSTPQLGGRPSEVGLLEGWLCSWECSGGGRGT